ncbi:MAG: NAD-dependent epimerase/dehydratase family protein, partial [Actinomycetota bacterium]|nr:NAD-dependent epimerase/dehydratase family protein [Actinomycetota bacterium]
LVTGGAGFIGSHVVRALRRSGAEVVVADLVRSADQDTVSVQVDLRSPVEIERVLPRGVDSVVHLAAVTSVLRSVECPAETFATNVAMTAELLERARTIGVGTFVFASSNAVVGAARELPITEHSDLAPLTPYGATKAAAEMLLSAYQASYGMRCATLRLPNVYGPGMGRKDSVIPRLMRAAGSGQGFEVFGDGRQMRDYLYVGDVVAAVEIALAGDRVGEVAGPIVVGSGVSTSVLELVALVGGITGRDIPVRHVPRKAGEMSRVMVDSSRAHGFGWRPTINLEEGLSRVWQSWPGRGTGAGPVLVGPARLAPAAGLGL